MKHIAFTTGLSPVLIIFNHFVVIHIKNFNTSIHRDFYLPRQNNKACRFSTAGFLSETS